MSVNTKKCTKDNKKEMVDFILDASDYGTLLMRQPVLDMENFGGWFQAGTTDGYITSLLCMEGTNALLYTEDSDSMCFSARFLFQRTRRMRSPHIKTYSLVGDTKAVDAFWSEFHTIDREIVTDRERTLWGATEADDSPKPGLLITPATVKDTKVIYEFTGEQRAEQWGVDPRRLSKEQHLARTVALIESGKMLVGRERGRPVFICQLHPLKDKVILERLFVPRPLRIRKKLMMAAVRLAMSQALKTCDEVLFFTDASDALWNTIAKRMELHNRRAYRLLVMRGH